MVSLKSIIGLAEQVATVGRYAFGFLRLDSATSGMGVLRLSEVRQIPRQPGL